METPESPEISDPKPDSLPIPYLAGFWRRLAALMIDSMVLCLFGILLAFFLQHQFALLGQTGRIIGFVIAGIYFSILNSKIGNGQTLGKRILNLRVVRNDGSPPGPFRSFARYLVLALPYFLNGVFFESGGTALGYLLSFIVFGMGFSILYLSICNRATRQSLHDVLAGTFVINNYAEPIDPPAIPSLHYGVVALLLSAPLIFTAFIPAIAKPVSLDTLMKTRSRILELPFAGSASINDNTFTANGVSTTNLYAKVFLKSDDITNEALALQVAETVLAYDSASHGRDKITVHLCYGFDIGIASKWKTMSYVESPSDWTEKSKH